MNNERLIVEERSRDIGDFIVGRLLPVREKRQIGPFTFIDHMGPVVINPGEYFDIDQHPHIGLSTLTYLLEGEIHHRDSTGADKIIKAGDVGFMTSGEGVAHTERTPENLRKSSNPFSMHGYQIWVALPKEKEKMSPRFDFISNEDLPKWKEDGLECTLVAGEGFGRKSPLPVHSPLFMVDLKSKEKQSIDIKDSLKGEIGIVVTHGSVTIDNQLVNAGSMLISKTENECKLEIDENSRIILFGGEAFPEKRYLYWNFVSSSREEIELAKERWAKNEFPKVLGDNTYIPLPK